MSCKAFTRYTLLNEFKEIRKRTLKLILKVLSTSYLWSHLQEFPLNQHNFKFVAELQKFT